MVLRLPLGVKVLLEHEQVVVHQRVARRQLRLRQEWWGLDLQGTMRTKQGVRLAEESWV